MTNSALNTRAFIASAALLAGANLTERAGVVIRRSEYTQPDVRIDGGIGSTFITVDQRLDAIAALIEENDPVAVHFADNAHLETTVSPGHLWNISEDSNPAGKVLRSGSFLNLKGDLCTASLVLGDNGLVVAIDGPKDEPVTDHFTWRVGVIMKSTVYTRKAHRPAATPLIGTADQLRVKFLVRLDDGLGGEMVTIDQTLDANAALLRKNDQVSVHLIDHAHVEPTVNPNYTYGKVSEVGNRDTLRTGEFIDRDGRPMLASLLLGKGEGGLVVLETPLDAHRAAA
jgi:hypothetical protein